jgi:hypothetical protein
VSLYRGKRLFAGRLFAGRLWGPTGSVEPPASVWPGAGPVRRKPVVRKRRRDTDDDVLLFLLR